MYKKKKNIFTHNKEIFILEYILRPQNYPVDHVVRTLGTADLFII